MTKISIRVIPNASKTEIAGREGTTYKIRVAAPPVDGKANSELIEFLSDVLDIPKSSIDVIKGQSGKQKIIEVPMTINEIEELLR
ncbi:MAG: DUF167 domain-containing protein [Patescibacteria group bacterium]|nr:DUF167 domain-containing protein [Patescibacteria group bacterium]